MNLLPLNKTLITPTKLEKTALLFCAGLSVFAFLFPEFLTEHLQPTINKILGYLGSPFFYIAAGGCYKKVYK